jgi:hypothetical protein
VDPNNDLQAPAALPLAVPLIGVLWIQEQGCHRSILDIVVIKKKIAMSLQELKPKLSSQFYCLQQTKIKPVTDNHQY